VVECRSNVCDEALSLKGVVGQTSVIVIIVSQHENIQGVWSVVVSWGTHLFLENVGSCLCTAVSALTANMAQLQTPLLLDV
jgi:hypothetical protein